MRFPPFPAILRTLYTFSNITRNSTAYRGVLQPFNRHPVLKSMPSFPFLSSLFSSSNSRNMSYPVEKSEDEWQAVLNKGKFLALEPHSTREHANTPPTEQFRVLREKGTEAPYTGKYDKHAPTTGVYTCAACSAPLYTAKQKFKSGCGWPAFYDTVPGAVTRHVDRAFGMERTEIVCSNCGGHLGHVFKGEGYATPTDERHCVNSVSMKFAPDDKVVEKGESKV